MRPLCASLQGGMGGVVVVGRRGEAAGCGIVGGIDAGCDEGVGAGASAWVVSVQGALK